MVEAIRQRRYRLSIRTLMIAVALCALLFTPVVWMSRQARQQRLLAQLARDQALQARYLAQTSSAQAAHNAAKRGPTNPKTSVIY
jgi:hypothetical protein